MNLSINSDTPNDISKAISHGIEKFSKILLYDKPDLAIVLGDRYEIFSFVKKYSWITNSTFTWW